MAPETASKAAATARYSTVAITLHWLIGALLLFELGLGLRMEAAQGAAKFAVFQLHKSVGITILLLAVMRLLWRFMRKPPELTAHGWERALAWLVHSLFYVLLFALPLSGWLIISTSRIAVPTLLFGAIPWPHVPGFATMAADAKEAWHGVGEFAHGNLVTLLYVLIVLHVAGALKHHFLDGDGDLARMLPGAKAGAWAEPRLLVIGLGAILASGLGLRWLSADAPAPVETENPAAAAKPAVVPGPASLPEPSPATSVADADPTAIASESPAATEEAPARWAIAPGSTVQFATTWAGDAVNGGFNRFDGDITFSPDALDKSRVEVRINTGSVFSGDDQRDDTLKSADWFAAATSATAVFRATRFRQTGADRYVANGTLTMKGVTLPLALPFTLTIRGDKATMRGSATIDRTSYKIGEGEYAATDEIPAAVKVNVTVNATRRK